MCGIIWNHCTSTPHRSETNGIAERAVRRVKEGTSAVLLQSGLDNEWWADSMECYTYLRNIQDLLSDAKTPNERRYGMPFNAPVIPFGAMVEYHPISAKDLSKLHLSGAKVLSRKFLGRTSRQKTQCKGSVNVAKKWKLHVPSREWNCQKLRERTASDNIQLNPGASFEENETDSLLQLHFKTTQRGMMRKLEVTSGLLQEISFTTIMRNPESNCACRKKNHFLFR